MGEIQVGRSNRSILKTISLPLLMTGTVLVTSAESCDDGTVRNQSTDVCSPITKLEQINRPLTWGERTLDEVAAGAKFRAVYLLMTADGQGPFELSLEDGFKYEVGQNYCH